MQGFHVTRAFGCQQTPKELQKNYFSTLSPLCISGFAASKLLAKPISVCVCAYYL
jgi:hypothetical protein